MTGYNMRQTGTHRSATILIILSSSRILQLVPTITQSGSLAIATAFVTSYPGQVQAHSRAEDHFQPSPIGSSSSCSVGILGHISNNILSAQIVELCLRQNSKLGFLAWALDTTAELLSRSIPFGQDSSNVPERTHPDGDPCVLAARAGTRCKR